MWVAYVILPRALRMLRGLQQNPVGKKRAMSLDKF